MSQAIVSTKGHLIDAQFRYDKGTIIEHGGEVYDCTLNQTEIGSNKNKFYIMQVIKHSEGICCYIRYGRIGEAGKTIYKPYDSEIGAVAFFERQFHSKTGNYWHARDNFVKKNRKYFMSEIETIDVSSGTDPDSGSESESSKLDPDVISFIKLMTNTTYMTNTMVELEIDTKKMPLGKISQGQIDRAYEILNDITQHLDDIDEITIQSSEFYTLIPHACGRQQPPIISSHKLIAKNLNLLNELSQMIFGAKAIKKLKKDSIGDFYTGLHTDIKALDKTSEMYKILVRYVKNSRAPTHNFKYSVINIFEIEREFERDNFEAFSKKIKNKTLLFHGTRISNLVGIFQNGLLCDPSKLGINVCITGKMFGLGLYYANSASKSIQYCGYNTSDNIACLFVAEVALGRPLKKKKDDSSLTAHTMPKSYHSTWGIGRSSFDAYDVVDNVRIPKGKLKVMAESVDSILLYDEFIIYHEEQAQLRYAILLNVK